LPTSLTRILLCTRGCSPWRPDAVYSTPRRREKLVPELFKGRDERTRPSRNDSALPHQSGLRRVKRFRSHLMCQEEKKDSSEGSPRRRPVARRCRTSLALAFRNFNRIPFRDVVRFVKSASFKPVWDVLRSDSLVSYRSSHETFLHFSPQGSHLCSRYFHQDLH
jgi:hypothetical protein